MNALNSAFHAIASLRDAAPPNPPPLRIGDIIADRDRYRVWRSGREIRLGTREFHLLALLMGSPGRVYTRDQILDAVWGEDAQVTDRNVDAYVKRLRRALGGRDAADPIRTVRNVGYAFDEFYGGS